MEKEYIYGQINLNMKDNGNKINLKALYYNQGKYIWSDCKQY